MSGHTSRHAADPPGIGRAGLIKKISLTIIHVSDLQRSVHFYRDLLGLKLIAHTSEWAEFMVGDCRLALQSGGDPTVPLSHRAAGYVSFSFEVDDVVEAHEVLNAAGVEFIRPPSEQDFGMLAVMRDPDGREIMLFEPS